MPHPSTLVRRFLAAIAFAAWAVALPAGLGTLAAFGARHDWRLELLCHFRVQYFWGLFMASVAMTVTAQRRAALAAFVLALVNSALIVPLYFGPAPPAASAPSTRALSINVRFLNDDYDRTIAMVRREQPDFALFLEVTPQWSAALRALDGEYPFSQVLPRRDAAGIALYSRVPIEQFEVRGRATIGLPTFTATLALRDGLLTLLGTHPASPGSPEHFAMRNRQFEALGRWAREADGAVMVLGDLNSTSWSPYFSDMLRAGNLLDSRRGFGVEPTWPNLPLPLRIPIDHCLVSGQIAIHARRVGGAVGSDHRPIVVDFSLSAP